MSERIIAEAEITYKDGTVKDILAEAKLLEDIGECKKGTIVILVEKSGDNLTGLFLGLMNENDKKLICLGSVDDPSNILTFPKDGLEEYYFEEIDEMPKGEAEIIQNFEE
jgi:hypothetical protein